MQNKRIIISSYTEKTDGHSATVYTAGTQEKSDAESVYHSSTQKISNWKSLSQLNGKYYAPSVSTVGCEMNYHIPDTYEYNHTFFGSELLAYPSKVDIHEQVCKFRTRKAVEIRPILPSLFPLVIPGTNICNVNGSGVDLLLLIKSAPLNFAKRQAIRDYWGNLSCWGGRIVKKVFLLGHIPESTIHYNNALHRESEMYQDIIQQGFVDNYRNNTYKMLFGFQWALSYCTEAKWFLFLDDDVFVHPENTIALIEGIHPRHRRRLVLGELSIRAIVFRSKFSNSKWTIGQEDYIYPIYPTYAAAGAFIVGPIVALDIYISMRYTKYLPFDDVFVGIAMEKLLLAPVNNKNMHITIFFPMTHSRRIKRLIAFHGINARAGQSKYWKLFNCQRFCT